MNGIEPSGAPNKPRKAFVRVAARIWQARLRRWMRPPRRAYPTKAGMFVLGAPIMLGVAAVTSSNNLLFLLLGGTLGAIVLSGILSERNIRGVSVRIRALSAAHVDEVTRLEVEVRRADVDKVVSPPPLFSLKVAEALPRPWLKALSAASSASSSLDTLDVSFPVVDGSSERRLAERVFRQRGAAALSLCELSTRYPFGLLVKTRDIDPELTITVRPRRVELPPLLSDPGPLSSLGEVSDRRGTGLEIFGLREREERDLWSRVHGLRSLALGRDVVLDMAAAERPRAAVGLLNVHGADLVAFERAVELCAAAIVAWDALGYAVGLTTSSFHADPGEVSVDHLLDVLALVELDARPTSAQKGPALWFVPKGATLEGEVGTALLVDQDGRVSQGGLP